jgi:diguanylate cyclase (GGDEF)-like protein/PAS domain S-box-containing protein
MNKTAPKTNRSVLKYTLFGILFGLVFPVLATASEILNHAMAFSWQTITSIHSNRLIWIIDSAPFFLGIFAYNAGIRQRELLEQAGKLEQLVEQRSKEIIRQKLFYEALVDNNPIATVTLDQDQRVISINPAFQNLFGYRQEEVMGVYLDEIIANPERPQEATNITRMAWEGSAVHEFGKRRRKDNKLVDVEIFGEQIRVNGNRIGILGLYRDITAEKEAQEALSASEERFRIMFDDSPVALRMEDYSLLKQWLDENYHENISLADYAEDHPDFFTYLAQLPKIIDLNDATLWMFGADDKQEMQNFLHEILSSESRREALIIVDAMRDGKTTVETELIYNRLDGKKIYTITKLSIIPGHEKDWSRVLFSNMDITERKLAEERLTYISLHDIMTGIYNRAFFEEEMSRLSRSRYYPFSILVMDMDNLKKINDQYGHQTGDIALQNMANIIKSCFRSEDVIARIGGDEMAVLLQGLDAQGVANAKERILEAIKAHNQLNPADIQISISIGCGTATMAGESLTDIFKFADERMYEDKKKKKELKKISL